jgi:CubicO group peptidase (beta-lactamase class C family)
MVSLRASAQTADPKTANPKYANSQTAPEIIQKYLDFLGGQKLLKAIRSRIDEGTYNYGGIEFPFISYAKAPDFYKYTVSFKGKYFTQAFDGDEGWKIDVFKNEKEKTILHGRPARAMANEADVHLETPFINYRKKGYRATVVGVDTIDKHCCYRISLQNATDTAMYDFDQSTGGLLKKTAISKNAELNSAILDTYYTDYTEVQGINIPFKIVHTIKDQVVLTVTVKKCDLNQSIPDDIFNAAANPSPAGMPASAQNENGLDTLTYLRNNPNVYAILVQKDDHLLYRQYYNNRDENSLFNEQSLAKSVCSLLIGIAIDKGYIKSVDEKLADLFPELMADTDKRKQAITVRMVMNQASGLYHEDLTRLRTFLELPDPSGYVLSAPLVADPGKEWHYDNAASHLLSVIITKVTHMDTKSFADKNLFGPLGITQYEWAKMKDGYYDGSGLLSIQMRSADMLRIGELILNNGIWTNQRIVSEKWINAILDPKVHYPATWGFPNSSYGFDFYHFVYQGVAVTYGMGWGGQFLVIIPTLHAVVMINENISDVNAIRQSNAFIHQIFPVIFDQLK